MEHTQASLRARSRQEDRSAQSAVMRAPKPDNPILQLQRDFGNRTVQRMAESGIIQMKLSVSRPGDPYEQEADRIAEQVADGPDLLSHPLYGPEGTDRRTMSQVGEEGPRVAASPLPSFGKAVLQRRCTGCEGGAPCAECEEEEKTVQRKSEGGSEPSGPLASEVLSPNLGPGSPLDPSIRSFMEPRLQSDFGNVRVHIDSSAAESARRVNALAYTIGSHMIFGAGQYTPETQPGRRLIAHELAHVVQQSGGNSSTLQQVHVGTVDDPVEHEADNIAETVTSGREETVRPRLTSGAVVRRLPLTPQGLKDEPRKTTVDVSAYKKVEITRFFRSCPCSEVNDKLTGIFYNPNLQNLAIAYKHCHGATTFEAYLRTATAFSQGTAPWQGDVRTGIEVNVWGTNVQGRVLVEALGTNRGSGPGVGGHAQIVFQGGKWRVFLESQYLRQLAGLAPGTNPNKLDVDIGGEVGKFSAEVKATDILSPTREIYGEAGYAITPDLRIIASFDYLQIPGRSAPSLTPMVGIGWRFGGPTAKKETCQWCFCPPPVQKYSCRTTEYPEPKPITKRPVFRYYFKYWKTDPSEDSSLASESNSNLEQVRALIGKKYRITEITAYASPEGPEVTINRPLAEERAKQIASLLSTGSNPVPVPPVVFGRSELYGWPESETSPGTQPSATEEFRAPGERTATGEAAQEIANPKLAARIYSALQGKTADQWMAFFGLDTSDPLGPHVQELVRAFLRSGGRDARRLEQVYRLLRYAAIVLEGTETPEQVPIGPVRAGVPPSDEECERMGRETSKKGEFGPIDPDALLPSAHDVTSDESCQRPNPDDVKAGCNYTPPANVQGGTGLVAPSYAPFRMRQD